MKQKYDHDFKWNNAGKRNLDYSWLAGTKRGKLIVLELVANQDESIKPSDLNWLCQCDCGSVVTRQTKRLIHNKRLRCRQCRAPWGAFTRGR